MSKTDSPVGGPLGLIAGPTASGKSGLALRLADALAQRDKNAVIVNADSMQVYRDIPILSAAPEPGDMARHPHRLYLAWDGSETCSAADWAIRAKVEIEAAHADDAVPILVGGTGLYMRTLLEGIAPIPPIDPDIRAEVRALDQTEARAALESEDAEAAARLAPADRARTARALEIVRSTGRTQSHWQARKEGGIGEEVSLNAAILLPDREWLYGRCEQRFELMLEAGAVAEVEALLARNLDTSLPVMRAIGVAEIASWIDGSITRQDMTAAGKQATRNYAKRQYTWFRNQPPANWVRFESQNFSIDSLLEGILRE
ncbi:tRNA (adenosine(37)-N6)-dimethylallyltransferase MiaA [Qipengyuania sp. CAU 1752]